VYSSCGTLGAEGGCSAGEATFYGPLAARPSDPLWCSARHRETHVWADRASKPLALSGWLGVLLQRSVHNVGSVLQSRRRLWAQASASALPAAEQAALRMKMTRSLLDALEAGERDPENLRQAALEEVGERA
jgi:hypothetical protein